MAARKTFILMAIPLLTLVGGAASPHYVAEAVTQLKPAGFSELQSYLRDHKPDVDQFRPRGPFGVDVHENHEIAVSTEPSDSDLVSSGFRFPEKAPRYPSAQKLAPDHIDTDLFLSEHAEKAPPSSSCMDTGDRE